MDVLRRFEALIETYDESHEFINVDLTTMLSEFKTETPIAVPYIDSPETFADLPYVILHNFFNYCPEQFPLYALRCLYRVVTKNIDDIDTKPRLLIMLHLTKMSVVDLPEYINRFERLYVVPEETNTEIPLQLVDKAIKHPKLNKIINNLIKQSFGEEFAKHIGETNSIDVTVKLVATFEFELRGFCGINIIYVNSTYFKNRRFQLGLTQLPETDKILVIDILTVVIHEYAHIRARQIANNCNHSTPKCIVEAVNENDPEFGRMIERALFSVPIDWMKSLDNNSVGIGYIEQFIEAIDKGEEIPILNATPKLIARTGSSLMHGGLDICVEQSIE
ncbi:hypothetical protein HA402_016170 [Bradysia odoriphaga]|nr:hypothetical protein HA402_016170 [Bradysia odoriphaga]